MADNDKNALLVELYTDLLAAFMSVTETFSDKSKPPEKISGLPKLPKDKRGDDFYRTFKEQRKLLKGHFDKHLQAFRKAQSCSMVLQRIWKLKQDFDIPVKQSKESEGAEENDYRIQIQVLEEIDECLSKYTGEKKRKIKPKNASGAEIQVDDEVDKQTVTSITEKRVVGDEDTKKSEHKYQESQKALAELTAKLISLQEKEQDYKDIIHGHEQRMEQPENIMKRTNAKLEKEAKEYKRKIKETQSELDMYTTKFRKTEKDNERLEKLLHTCNGELKEVKKENKRLKELQQKRPQTAPAGGNRQIQAKIEALTKEKTFFMDQSRALKDEKDSLMQRLSKVAGTKMRDNNPAIADLSDPNRPERLSEQFRELYDNAWTDLLDKLNDVTEQPDDVCVKIILDTVKKIYTECENQVGSRKERILKLLGYQEGSLKKQYSGGQEGHDPNIKLMKDLIKNSGERMLEPILECVEDKEEVASLLKSGETSAKKFVSKCTEICIYMSVQDPPVVLDFSFKRGDPLNKDCLNPFTKNGDTIDYFVWPPMYLHKHGTMMSKGIAEGMANDSTRVTYSKAGKDKPTQGRENNSEAKDDEQNKESSRIEKDTTTSGDDNDVVIQSKVKNESAKEQKSDKLERSVTETKKGNVAKESTHNEALQNETKIDTGVETEISESRIQDEPKDATDTKL